MLYTYDRDEIKRIVELFNEGKTYTEIVDELYPKSEYQAVYDCAVENMRSFSLLKTIYNALIKKAKPAFELPRKDCFTCIDS